MRTLLFDYSNKILKKIKIKFCDENLIASSFKDYCFTNLDSLI